MSQLLATMLTMSTYGTWLRGDARGWVEKGVTFPPDPVREQLDFERMKHEPFRFAREDRHEIGNAVGRSLTDRLHLPLYALCIQSWHAHMVYGVTSHEVSKIVKCAKDAARWHLRVDRPIWATGYDKRFCFDGRSVRNRIEYVERHNLEDGLSRRPWGFLMDFRE